MFTATEILKQNIAWSFSVRTNTCFLKKSMPYQLRSFPRMDFFNKQVFDPHRKIPCYVTCYFEWRQMEQAHHISNHPLSAQILQTFSSRGVYLHSLDSRALIELKGPKIYFYRAISI